MVYGSKSDSNWTMFHPQLTLPKNSYPENFIDRFFKLFLNRIHISKEKAPTVEKKPFRLVFHYLGTISLQTRTKLQKSRKELLKCCKLQVVFNSQDKLCQKKTLFPKLWHNDNNNNI